MPTDTLQNPNPNNKIEKCECETPKLKSLSIPVPLLHATPTLTPPMQEDGGNDTDADNQRRSNSRTGSNTDSLEHGSKPELRLATTLQNKTQRKKNIPERTKEAPNLPDKRDEHTDVTSFLREAIDSIGDHYRGDQLVSDSANSGADNGRYVPMSAGRFLRTDQEDDYADDGECETEVAEPQTEFRLSLAVDAAAAPAHPEV